MEVKILTDFETLKFEQQRETMKYQVLLVVPPKSHWNLYFKLQEV